jgi:uncharacterized SAM-binding protein YcdF (DUF218 family)
MLYRSIGGAKGARIMRDARVDRLCRITGLVGVVLFLVVAFSPLAHVVDVWMAVEPRLVPSDAIVVLGAAASPSGTLSLESSRRTQHGIDLYRRGLAPRLILLGGARGGGLAEAEARAQLARLHSIPAAAILTETRARTTREEAIRVKELGQSRGVRTILLVTNSGHLMRARPLFERVGFDVRPAPSDTFGAPTTPEGRLALMRAILHELLGWLYYRIAGYT